MPVLKDMDRELGTALLTPTPKKRRTEREHSEEERIGERETAGLGIFISACSTLTTCVTTAWLFGGFGATL